MIKAPSVKSSGKRFLINPMTTAIPQLANLYFPIYFSLELGRYPSLNMADAVPLNPFNSVLMPPDENTPPKVSPRSEPSPVPPRPPSCSTKDTNSTSSSCDTALVVSLRARIKELEEEVEVRRRNAITKTKSHCAAKRL